jgi:hypothetical protein
MFPSWVGWFVLVQWRFFWISLTDAKKKKKGEGWGELFQCTSEIGKEREKDRFLFFRQEEIDCIPQTKTKKPREKGMSTRERQADPHESQVIKYCLHTQRRLCNDYFSVFVLFVLAVFCLLLYIIEARENKIEEGRCLIRYDNEKPSLPTIRRQNKKKKS